MSNAWSVFVIVLAVGNIAAMLWLLLATSKPNDLADSDTTGHKWDDIEELNNPLPRWWLGLFIITIVFAFIYLYLYPGLGNFAGSKGWSQTGQFLEEQQVNRAQQAEYFGPLAALPVTSLAENVKAMETAGRLFANNCSTCHGADAGGAKGFPNLRDNDWLYGGAPEQILTSIINGRAGVMPNLQLSELNVAVLTEYVRSLSGTEVSDHIKQVGPQRFAVCAACHGQYGQGNQAVGAPNLTDDIWLHGGSPREIQAVLRGGVNANMPSFSNSLSETEIKLLAAYVWSLSQPNDAQGDATTLESTENHNLDGYVSAE